jgi:SAM-dependent methyltransferase
MGIGEMNFQAIWKNFGRYFGQTILHPQFLINRAAAMHRQRTRQLLKGRILDVGSGDSTSLKGLPEITGYITLDFPPTNARYLQRPDVFGDARHLPFPDASFEQIFLLEVLEHIPEPSHVPREIKRCLKQGGLLFLSTPCLYPLHDEPHDFQRFTRHGLRMLFPGAEWERVEEEEFSSFFGFMALSGNLQCMHSLQAAVESHAYYRLLWLLPLTGLMVLLGNLGGWATALFPSKSRFPVNYWLILRKK